jgi:ribosomal protein S13
MHKVIVQPLNIMFSQIHTVNHRVFDLKKLNIIRLYLIKSYRGRSHALGKPVRGQRTWSNA